MSNYKIKTIFTFTVTLLLMFLFLPAHSLATTQGPWEVKKNEIFLQGVYLGTIDKLIQIKIEDKVFRYSYSSQAIFALMGLHSGKLVSLSQFPSNITVQVILDENGSIRAMRNKIEHHQNVPGKALETWGHLATLSPKEKHYTLYHFWQGLYLHSFKNNDQPVYLSTQPLCAWSNKGTKLAYADHQHLGIYNTETNTNKIFPFPHNSLGTVRVVTSLDWNSQDDKILYTYLEDFPQQGSDFMQITVLDQNGKELATKTVENLGPVCWLTKEIIAIVINPPFLFDSSEEETGKIILWDYQNDKTTHLVQELKGYCYNLCLNQQATLLYYTLTNKENWQEELYLHNLETKKTTKINTFNFPVYNLQCSKDNIFIFWDRINNAINLMDENGEILNKYAGFLPEKSVAQNFLFFPEEPLDEPLPVWFSTIQAGN